MNGKILRGEVYWVRDALTNGSEEAFRRPFVVVSNNRINEKIGVIIGAAMTTKVRDDESSVYVRATGRKTWVMTNHLIEVAKDRLMDYCGRCTDKEMELIDEALLRTLDLERGEVESHESDVYKKMYEKVLEELVATKMELDRVKREAVVVAEPPKVVKEVPKEKSPVKKITVTEKVNINTATAEAISIMLGIPETTAYLITGYRRQNGNFVDIEELRDVLGLPKGFVEKYGDKIVIDEIKKNDDEIKPKTKVNVNTATPTEIREKTGMSIDTCNKIRAYRNKNGPFKKVEDLLNVDRFGSGCMKKYRHLLEV